MRALILAAGRGERLRPLTDHTPKPLIQIGKETLLERHLRRLAAVGVDTVFINVAWLAERIVAAIGDGRRFGLRVVFSHERPGALETLGGIRQVLPWLGDEPFWLVNGDVFSDFDFSDQITGLPTNVDARLVLVPNPSHKPQGDFDIDGEFATRAESKPRPYTYSGIGLYRPVLFAGVTAGRAPLAPLLFAAANAGRIAAVVHRGRWDDVGTAERLARLRQWLEVAPTG
ncbi:MAG: N-acetylmuramate alpha-1-phosphate uridylyltransferase MurU [Pseudomonadota bacterium]